MTCKHCATELTDHDTFAPKSGGALHCFGCGCCFLLDGKTPREGVPDCGWIEPESEPEPEPEPEPSNETEAKPVARRRGRR